MAQFWARHVKQQRGMMWRDDGMVLLLWWWWCGHLVGHARLREGVWAKNAKPSCRSSVSRALCETAAGDGAYRWGGGAYEVVVVMGWCLCETRGGGCLSQKDKTEPSWLSFGHGV